MARHHRSTRGLLGTAHHATITARPVPDGGLVVSVAFPQPASPKTRQHDQEQMTGYHPRWVRPP